MNGERFAGLNFCGFHPMKSLTGKLSRCLTFKTFKQCHHMKLVYNTNRKTFAVLLNGTFSYLHHTNVAMVKCKFHNLRLTFQNLNRNF